MTKKVDFSGLDLALESLVNEILESVQSQNIKHDSSTSTENEVRKYIDTNAIKEAIAKADEMTKKMENISYINDIIDKQTDNLAKKSSNNDDKLKEIASMIKKINSSQTKKTKPKTTRVKSTKKTTSKAKEKSVKIFPKKSNDVPDEIKDLIIDSGK
jgi:hypothetical protein